MSKGAWRDCPNCGQLIHMNDECPCGGAPRSTPRKSKTLDQIADDTRKKNGLDEMPNASATWGPLTPACDITCQACGEEIREGRSCRWIRFEMDARKYIVCRECFADKKMLKHQDLHQKILKHQSRLVTCAEAAWFNNGRTI